jgi:hypothetical protein
MAFSDVAGKIPYAKETSDRYKRLDAFDRLRQGTLYDHIKHSFDDEYQGTTYIKMRERRPSIIWNGASMLVDQLSGLLWGDEQMPIVRTYLGEDPSESDRTAEEAIQHLSETLNLDGVMDNVTDLASSGSAAIVVRATPNKGIYIDILPGKECTPTFDPRDPDHLLELEQCYPTTGTALADMGYEIKPEDLTQGFWFRLTIDATNETRYLPMRADKHAQLGKIVDGKAIAWEIDAGNTWAHEWPVIPVVWAKAPSRGVSRVDGDCLYGKIVDMLVSIDYDLSQVERGFRYTADPMLAITRGELKQGARPAGYTDPKPKTQNDGKGKIIKSPTTVLDIEAGGEAKMLEISGNGLDKSREFISTLREWGLEIAGGMKSDASTTKGVESGRALEMLFQSLILVVKRWRVSLGNMGYLPLLKLLLAGIEANVIAIEGVEGIAPDTIMRLIWPTWMTPSGTELYASAQAWQTLAGGSPKDPVAILPRKTITRLAGGNLGMTDTSTLVDEVAKQNADDDAAAQAQADQAHAKALAMQAATKPAQIAPPVDAKHAKPATK